MVEPWQAGQYANETYLQSLRASSLDVKRQVANALAEIGRQRSVAVAQTGQIPGATNQAFGEARSTLQGDLAGLGISPLASLLGAFGEGQAAYGRASGLLAQGFGEQAVQRRGGVDTVQQQLMADLRGKGNSYVSQRQGEDRDRQFREQESARQRALQQALQDQAARLQQQMLAAQGAEAQRNRLFQSGQSLLDRQSQTSLTNLLLAPMPAPTYTPPPAPAPAPTRPKSYWHWR